MNHLAIGSPNIIWNQYLKTHWTTGEYFSRKIVIRSIFLSGSNGFIGSNLSKSDLFKDDNIIPLDLRYLSKLSTKSLGEELSKHMNTNSHIIHLASPTDKRTIHEGNFLDVSIKLSKTMLEISELIKPKKFIYMSSGKASWTYKNKTSYAINPLGNVKLQNENYLQENIGDNTQLQIIRLYNAFGPFQKVEYFIPKIIDHIRKDKVLRLGTLNHKRDFIFIDNVLEAIDVLLKSNTNECLFELGSGQSIEMSKILDLILSYSEKKLEIVIEENLKRNYELHEEIANINNLEKLGWTLNYNLEKGIQKTLEHYE